MYYPLQNTEYIVEGLPLSGRYTTERRISSKHMQRYENQQQQRRQRQHQQQFLVVVVVVAQAAAAAPRTCTNNIRNIHNNIE